MKAAGTRALLLAAALATDVGSTHASLPLLFAPASRPCFCGRSTSAPARCSTRDGRICPLQRLHCSEDTPDSDQPVQNLQSSEKALRKNIKAAKGGLQAEIQSLREEDASSILGRMRVPRPEDSAKRGTSTTFLVEELKVRLYTTETRYELFAGYV